MYLTFDDGPHPVYTPQVLDVLARYGARATFFVVGSLAESYPGTTQRIIDEGHTIGNHTWNHEALGGLTREEFDETVGRTQALLGHRGTACLRPPYASMDEFTRDWAAAHGLAVVTWDTSPQDWLQISAQDVAQHLVDYARDGVVMLLHDGGGDRSHTVLGLDMALRELSDRGYRFEPLCS
ncbi:MAG: polysaccharide deacetylase family protein [Acidimicrobiia bacterium]|nr:polysaccharide deacetylase family protein [Acidimicrobiia bacterium]MCY4434774.1 polysaccharide deacetylase family protein [bacterium]